MEFRNELWGRGAEDGVRIIIYELLVCKVSHGPSFLCHWVNVRCMVGEALAGIAHGEWGLQVPCWYVGTRLSERFPLRLLFRRHQGRTEEAVSNW